MRQTLSIIMLLSGGFIFSSYLFTPNKDKCEKYRNGTFYYHFKIKEQLSHYTVTRNDSIQIEENNENGNIAKYKIRWTDDCSYELKFIEGTEVLPEKSLDLKKTMIVQTTILSGTAEYYLFRSKTNLSDLVLSDTVWLTK